MSDFTCNYTRHKKKLYPSSSQSFFLPLLSFSFSLHITSFFLFISQRSPIKSTSGCRGINLKVTLYPGPRAACFLKSSLSCSLTLSKKAQIIFPSTFLQKRLFGFLSLDQLSLPKSSPWAQGGKIITDGGN